MAQLNEQIVTLKISKLIRDNEPLEEFLDSETLESLEQVVGELAPGALVEIEKHES